MPDILMLVVLPQREVALRREVFVDSQNDHIGTGTAEVVAFKIYVQLSFIWV